MGANYPFEFPAYARRSVGAQEPLYSVVKQFLIDCQIFVRKDIENDLLHRAVRLKEALDCPDCDFSRPFLRKMENTG